MAIIISRGTCGIGGGKRPLDRGLSERHIFFAKIGPEILQDFAGFGCENFLDQS